MLKRLFLLPVFLVLMVILLTGCSGQDRETTNNTMGESNEVYELKVQSPDPEVSATGQFLNTWAEYVERESDGRLNINVYHGQLLGSSEDTVDMILDGTCDIGWGLQSYFPDDFPVSEVFSLPMLGITTAVQGSSAMWEFYNTTDYMKEEYSDFHVLLLSTSGDSPISTVDKKIEKVSDLEGMRIRATAGPPSAFVTNLGANPVSIPIYVLYEFLERNFIDGFITDWHAIESYRFYEVVKYYLNEHVEVTPYFMLMNKDKYNSLPEDLQKILDEASGSNVIPFTGVWDQYYTSMTEIVAYRGGEIYTLDETERAKLKEAADETANQWIDDMNKKGYDGQAIYEEAVELIKKYAE